MISSVVRKWTKILCYIGVANPCLHTSQPRRNAYHCKHIWPHKAYDVVPQYNNSSVYDVSQALPPSTRIHLTFSVEKRKTTRICSWAISFLNYLVFISRAFAELIVNNKIFNSQSNFIFHQYNRFEQRLNSNWLHRPFQGLFIDMEKKIVLSIPAGLRNFLINTNLQKLQSTKSRLERDHFILKVQCW